MVAVAVVGAAAIGAVATTASAKSASSSAQDATDKSIAAQKQGQDAALAAQQPFLDAGYLATNKLTDLLGLSTNTSAAGYGSLNTPFKFDSSNLASDPGYQFQLQQGQNALDRKAAAGGGFYSGQALEGASTFNQGLASTAFGDAYNRQFNAYQTQRSNELNPLQALAGQGQSSANTTGQIQTNGANSMASLLTGNANAQGAASIAQGNAISNGLNNGITNWQRANYMNQLNSPGVVGSGSTFFNSPTDAGSINAVNGSDAGFYISDIRLKTNISRIGTSPRGYPWYRWDWANGSGSDEGVIAQEVQQADPDAVRVGDHGFLTVNYSKV